ncbi:NAD(P)-dependent oxidoreductase [Brevibacterium sp. LE-L]|uniref:NAD(P)-dependent oxidoreductase n=1 Tax=unclassified Brevibacterium TaxID=2614124 RepID=UPI003CEDF28E
MHISVFGAAGPTGLWVCREARKAGHTVTAVSRRTDPLPLPDDPSLNTVCADAVTGTGVAEAVAGSDAVISSLGSAYSRRPISVYSEGTRHIVDAMRSSGRSSRLIVVSAGLTYPPPPMNWFADHLVFPLLRGVIGRTLYADMRAMEEYLQTVRDIDWTVVRPGRLINDDAVSDFRLEPGNPTRGFTSRPDLAAAMVSLLPGNEYSRSVVAPTTDVRRRKR